MPQFTFKCYTICINTKPATHFQWQETGIPFRNLTHNCIALHIIYFSSHYNTKT